MNPTTTEHDLRFPRRPGAAVAATGAPRFISNFQHHGPARESFGMRSELHQLSLDLPSPTAPSPPTPISISASVRDAVLQRGTFLPFTHSVVADSSSTTPEEMQRQDPIAFQVWRFFADTKKRLPEQNRMENLTWRMMHISIEQRRQAMLKRCEELSPSGLGRCHHISGVACNARSATQLTGMKRGWETSEGDNSLTLGFKRRQMRHSNALLNAPSGIAQLRKTSEQLLPQSEPMNLDDFINGDSVGTPSGLALTPTPEAPRIGDESKAAAVHTTASAIPIKPRREPAQNRIPQSVPVTVHHQRLPDEFGYIPRHQRKTSIDETTRRVSWRPHAPLPPRMHAFFHFIFRNPQHSDCHSLRSSVGNYNLMCSRRS